MVCPSCSGCVCLGTEKQPTEPHEWSVSADQSIFTALPHFLRIRNDWAEKKTLENHWLESEDQTTNMPIQVANDLNSLEWHRLLITVPPRKMMRVTAHNFPIAKNQSKEDQSHAEQCVQMIVATMQLS